MPIKGNILYPYKWIRRQTAESSQGIVSNTLPVQTSYGQSIPPDTSTSSIVETPFAEPLLIDLPETAFAAVGTWYFVLPNTIYSLPSRTGNTLLEVSIVAKFLWTANSGGQALCDWSTDSGVHFRRTFHTVVNRTDDSSVNDADLVFAVVVSGTSPAVQIQARQYTGPLGMTVAGTQTTAWPQLQSRALIIDQGPLA
jgi:hypothetical protein